jgi:hypothetical protein
MAQRARFEPRFTLGLVYFFICFIVYGLLLAAPAMLEAWRSLPPDADPAQAGREVVRHSLRGRLPLAVGAALVTVGGLTWARVLPGLRGPRS